MIGNYFAPLSGSKRNRIALLAASTIFVTGCANMATSAPDINPFSSAATLKGTLHGGNQPVAGATVNLYYAGQSGAPTLGATTTTANDGSGSFTFVKNPTSGQPASGNMFSCPTNVADPLVYLVAKGGNTINDGDATKNNTAAAFIAIFGTCNELTSANQVYMSETTTVATMAAAQQFFDPSTDGLSADGTGQQKIVIDELPTTIALLASMTTGNAVTSTSVPAATTNSNINPAVTITATPEAGKLNLLGNILSSCINNASATATPCTSLFSAAVPPTPNVTNKNPSSFPPAVDTLQAIFYMLTNPTSGGSANMTTLFGLAGGVGAPYQPYLNTQPTDWTIAINYASSSTCGTSTGGSGGFINSPVDIAIDGNDSVWFANSQAATGNLSELAVGGVPTTCVLLGTGAQGGTVIDSSANVWVGTTNGMYRYTPGTQASLLFPTGSTTPVGLAADGAGNVYFTGVSGSTGSLYQLAGAASPTSSPTATPATQISNTVGSNPIHLMPDYKISGVLNNIWVTSGSNFVSQVTAGVGSAAVNGFITNQVATSGSSYGLSINHGGSVYVAAMDTNAVTQLLFSNGSYSIPTGWPFAGAAAGISGPTAISIDPRNNTWLANNTNGASTGSVSEISNAPVALSPSTGFQKAQSYLSSGRALAIDQAGNVWIGGDGASFLTEIVGASVPIYQPYAAGLKNGRFQTIP